MIPTHEEFTTQVGRGPQINRVSAALADYWEDKGGRNLEEQVAALKALVDAGKAWIKVKDTKSDYKKNLFGQETGNINKRFVKRRELVSRLVEEASKELMRLLHANNLLTTDLRGQLTFDLRKFRQKGKLRILRHDTKSLSHGYEQERDTWVQSGKTKAISGTVIHGYVGPHNKDFFEMNELQQGRRRGLVNKKVQKSVDKLFQGGGTWQDWQVFSQLEQVTGDLRVLYLKKSQRYRHMAYIEGGLLVDPDGNAIDTTSAGNGFLWTMDQYGSLYIYPADLGRQYDIRQVNHSTMNSGREVICAGMIHVVNGVLTRITNASGHYKPTKQHLLEAVTILAEEQLNMDEAQAVAVRFPGPGPGLCYWDFYDAIQFVRTGGLVEPVVSEVGPEP